MISASQNSQSNGSDIHRAKRYCSRVICVIEKRRDAIFEQTNDYPTPIPACDEQFNYLLEVRARISSELTNLNGATLQPYSLRECRKHLDMLVGIPGLLDEETEQELRDLV